MYADYEQGRVLAELSLVASVPHIMFTLIFATSYNTPFQLIG